MKFIRDIISEKRAQAMGHGRVAPEAAPRPAALDEMPKAPPLPNDVMMAPRTPVAKPAFQLPLSALVAEDDDILNVLNPMDDDEAASAIAADDFEFGFDRKDEKRRAFGDVLAEDDEDDEPVVASRPVAAEPERAVVEADAVVSGLAADTEDAEAEADADEAEADFDDPDFEDAVTLLAEDDQAGDEQTEDEPVEVELADEGPAEDDTPDMVKPENLGSRAGLFSAIAAADMAQNEEEVTQAVSRWTGAMPSPPPRRPEAEDRPAMMAPPAAPRPEPQTPQTQSLSLRAAAPAPMPPRVAAPAPVAPRPSEDAASVDVPAPAIGRGSRRAGRVKTRLLGFNGGQARVDPFAAAAPVAAEAPEDDNEAAPVMFPVGWLVVVAGPGTGASFPLPAGVAQIGRGVGQAVRLDLGDNSISRENHAAVAYDAEERKFYLGHGGKANLVRRNNRPVLSTEELSSGDTVRIGETTLRFVALCGSDFDWAQG